MKRDEKLAMIEAFIASGRMTRCPATGTRELALLEIARHRAWEALTVREMKYFDRDIPTKGDRLERQRVAQRKRYARRKAAGA